MKKHLKIVLLLLMPLFGLAQQQYPDSLKMILKSARSDSVRYSALNGIGEYYVEINGDTALYYLKRALTIAKKNDRGINEAATLARIGYVMVYKGKYPESLECFQQALTFAEDTVNKKTIWNPNMPWIQYSTQQKSRLAILAGVHLLYSILVRQTGDPDQQILQLKISMAFADKAGDYNFKGVADMNMGRAYMDLGHIDSALLMGQNAEQIFEHTGYKKYLAGVLGNIGLIYIKKGKGDLAVGYFRKALQVSLEQRNFAQVVRCYSYLTGYFIAKKQKDSSLYYARKRVELVLAMNRNDIDQAYEQLYQSYQLGGNTDSAYKYQGLALAARDKNYETTVKSLADFQKLSFKTQLHLQKLEREKAAAQTRTRTYVLLGAIGIFMLLATIFYHNNRQKHRANYLLGAQKEEIETQRDNLGHALEELKNTQSQLVQREKMASLGELTAGIAHEIQNPLNFVNNFSEVNQEMLDELDEELNKGDVAGAKAIAADIRQNEEKINHHGKRADFIVKGMLLHSRNSSGEKELTDINLMADEFFKLSYQGLRAKDKNFNAEMATNFEKGLPKVNVAHQDIGRVLLNMFNNAFYAVNQKQKTAGTDYKPEVSISTYLEKNNLVIKVKDNGNGIPDAIKDKIMQPFFTTKPTGEGTGLGLSLSYDIVVKGHGGKIDLNSTHGEGATFTITLPSEI